MSAVPTAFGKYFLTEKIATGGMAEIYLAKLLGPGGFEKLLIIKQIHPEFGDRPEFVDLFVREAKTLVSLSHGNIVPVYELGVLEGTYFIAMEYIDGPTLAELLDAAPRRGIPIAPATAAFICAEVAKGLDYAHRKGSGVIHRDLSPRNVMLSRDGEVKIVDFGIAATVDDNLAGDAGGDGKPVGSFPYMSPEQVRHESLTPASDLFSVGILMWEALTGAKLFARDSADATLDAVLDAPIEPPSARNPAVPAELDAICLRALERDPDRRFASAGELHTKLTRYLYSVDPPVTAAALSSLVARACPPVPRERAITRDERSPSADGMDRTPRMDGTRPMPGRARRASTRTFATHVQFREVLKRATPLIPFDAIPETAAEAEAEAAAAAEARARAAARAAEAAAEPEPPPDLGPRRNWLGIAAAALLAGGVVAGLVATRGSPQAAARPDAGTGVVAPGPADAAPLPDAPPLADAAPPPDARPRVRRPRPDAAARVRRTGTLKVGAIPWADVYVDGERVGRAPDRFTISAGKHRVRLVHDDRERTFTVDVAPDGVTETPFVDFSSR